MSVTSHKRVEAVQPTKTRGPIDMVHLKKQTLGDPGLELEVLRLFDQMSHVYYSRLETSTPPELITSLMRSTTYR